MIHLASKQLYIGNDTAKDLIEQCRKTSIMIQKYINTTLENAK